MYQALLTRRYLTSKVMPLLASLAVVLCTAMVLVTWSVMGGFLKNLIESGRTLIGDVRIDWPNTGFAHYDELIADLERDTGFVAAAAPVIEAFGMLALPDGRNETVVIKGIDGESYDRVTGYFGTLYWRPIDAPLPKDEAREDWRLKNPRAWGRVYEDGRRLAEDPDLDPRDLDDPAFVEPEGGAGNLRPALVLGIEVSGFNIREAGGRYAPGVPRKRNPDGTVERLDVILPIGGLVTLAVLPLDSAGNSVEPVRARFPVANEFRTGLYSIDKNTVLAPRPALQKMLKMDRARRLVPGGAAVAVNPDGTESFAGPRVEGEEPARVTTVLVRAVAGVDARELAVRCREIYAAFAARHPGRVPPAPEVGERGGVRVVLPVSGAVTISTWEEQNRQFIAAVKKETALVLVLFSFISVTAVFLVLSIFWSMISEKTRDIGVLRALGAGRWGVAGLWLAYGLAIGVVGSLLGGLLSYVIVLNINSIHEWMGAVLGISIWDPAIYYLTTIPSRIDPRHAALVMGFGALSSVLGAVIPAWRAARMDPVRALRFE